MIIKLSQLKGACEPQRDLFWRTFGDRVEVTLDACREHVSKFCVGWVATHLFTKVVSIRFRIRVQDAADAFWAEAGPRQSTRLAACRAAGDVYARAIAEAQRSGVAAGSGGGIAYSDALGAAEAAYKEACSAADVTYNTAYAAALAQYREASAMAFFAACQEMDQEPPKGESV